jgi:hypothetical protein
LVKNTQRKLWQYVHFKRQVLVGEASWKACREASAKACARVTRLGDFSPIGRLFGRFLGISKIAQNSPSKSYNFGPKEPFSTYFSLENSKNFINFLCSKFV